MKPSVLPLGLKIIGDVEGEEDFVVHGTVDGDVHLAGHLTVESSGTVRGAIDVRSLTVRGVVVGDAAASEQVRIDAGAKLVGDVRAPRVNVVEGALVRGRVEMTGAPPPPTARDRRRPSNTGSIAPSAEPTVHDAPSPASTSLDTAAATMFTVDGSRPLADDATEPPTAMGLVPRFPLLRRHKARRKN